ncbi:lipopolysaccharide biosynthesis protein [Cohaesibacter celericrescens]|uniref:lipopolysaccharide biosynthesis protein n=1 Tax=Cohaesibacter celericrescens TaxID=2067669 RepID=UPI00356993C6
MTDTVETSSSVTNKIKQLFSNKVAQGIAGTMLMKMASAVIAFALFSLAANASGVEEFGRFSILFSVVSILSIVAAAGQELQVVRSWSEYLANGRPGFAVGALRYGWFVSSAGVVVISILLWVFFHTNTDWTPLTIKDKWPLGVAAIAFLATNTLSLYSSHAARAIVGIKVGDAHYEITWRAIAIVFLTVCLLMGRAVDTTEILTVFAFGLVLVIVSQAYIVAREVKRQVGSVKPEYDLKEWTPRSVRLWLAAIMEASNQHMEVFLIGMLLDPVAAGAYFVAARLSNAFALAASGLNTFGTRRVPGLYFARDIPALKHTLNLMAGMSLIIVAGGLLCVIIGGEYMLMIFGRSYMDYYYVLLILSIGTGLTAANGPAPSFLMLTGHEGGYMKVVTASVLFRVMGFFLIVPYFGIIGAATVTASVMVAMALLLNYYCRHFTGMDPSILRFILPSTDVPPDGVEKSAPAVEEAVP